jgi:hypothetical protein
LLATILEGDKYDPAGIFQSFIVFSSAKNIKLFVLLIPVRPNTLVAPSSVKDCVTGDVNMGLVPGDNFIMQKNIFRKDINRVSHDFSPSVHIYG